MKYMFTALLSGLVLQFCSAQITIQSGDLPVAPTTLNNGVDTMPSGVVVGPAGANQTWDYSNVTQHITENITHQTAAGSGYSGSFPTATNAVTPDGSTYGFFRNTGSAFVGQGLAGDLLNNGSTLVVQFSPTFDLYRFPTQYGGAFSGTYGFQQTAPGSAVGQPVNQVRITFVSNYTDNIDGHGEVTSPMGTYSCLRQKRVEYTDTHIEFKLFSFSSWSTADRIYDTTTTYNYLALETEGPAVTLAVNKQGDVTRVTYSLTPPAPVADFSADNPYGGLVNFTDESTNSPATYSWTFGDGGASTSANPSHTYAANGTYNVCLTVTNVSGTDTYCQNVTVNGIFTTSITGPSSVCSNEATGLTYSAPNVSGHLYTWTPIGGTITSGAGTPTVTINWNGSAPYTLEVSECDATGNFCATDQVAVSLIPLPTGNIAQTICTGESYLGYTTTGIYNDTLPVANGCDSVRILDLTVLPNTSSNITTTICFGDTLYGYSANGTYYDTLTAANTCDSVRVLNLTVRQQNIANVSETICFGDTLEGYTTTGVYTDQFTDQYGCDSTRILDLTVRQQNIANVSETICFGDTLEGYTTTGVYTDQFTDQYGCDSTRILDLTVRPQNIANVSETICFGDTLEGYSTTGIYTDQFTDQYGCDSTRVLNLTVRPDNVVNLNISICPGNSYEGYSTAGTYTDSFTDRFGCDSTRTVVLTLQSNIRDTVYREECFGGSYYGYTSNGTYVDTFSSANCDSIRVLFLTILPQSQQTVSQTICQGESYEGYTTGGTYTDNFTNSNGCDSTRTLQLTVLPTSSTTIDTSICFNTTFEGYGATGTYYDTLTAANTCDSVRIINLTVLPQSIATISQTICQGDSYLGYSTTGQYTDMFVLPNGCDSTRILDLTVLPNASSVIDTTICYNTTFEGYGATGTYYDTLTAANTCDSFRTINLTVLPQNIVTVPQTICQGDSYYGYTTAGQYTDVFTLPNGCDSTRILDLTVLPTASTVIDTTICYNTTFEGYGITGTYYDTLTAANTCDSFRTINLTVLPIVTSSSFDTICFGDALNGYTETGVYTINGTASTGCDSIHTLNLFVEPSVVTNATAAICDGDSVYLAGEWQTTSGTYTDTVSNGNCLDLLVTELTVNTLPVTPVLSSIGDTIISSVDDAAEYFWYLDGSLVDSTSGSALATSVEGEYQLTLVSDEGCSATSAPFDHVISSVSTINISELYNLYPNPTTGRLVVSNTASVTMQLTVFNALGEVVASESLPNGLHNLDLSSTDQGVYFVQVQIDGEKQVTKLIIAR